MEIQLTSSETPAHTILPPAHPPTRYYDLIWGCVGERVYVYVCVGATGDVKDMGSEQGEDVQSGQYGFVCWRKCCVCV